MTDNIIQIGDFALKRKQKTYGFGTAECQHKRVELDDNGDIVKCSDCGVQVSAYWALNMLAESYQREWKAVQAEKRHVQEEKGANIHLIAARVVEKAWRSRSMLPACPHCHRGIGPHDHFGGSMVNAKMEQRRRDAEREAKTAGEKP